jgi:hypothetical protein
MRALIIILTVVTNTALGQVKFGTYRLSSDTIEIFGSKAFSKLILNQDKTFKYEYRTSLSCFVWFDSQGTWYTDGKYVILTDSVRSDHPDHDMNDEIVLRTTTYFVNEDNLIFTKQRTSNDNLIPRRHLIGNFRLENE